jgi:predicted permease
MAPDFPYKYKVTHPFLHIKDEFHWIKTPIKLICVFLGYILVPLKLILAATAMGLGGFFANLLDRTTDGKTMLTGFRKLLYHFI